MKGGWKGDFNFGFRRNKQNRRKNEIDEGAPAVRPSALFIPAALWVEPDGGLRRKKSGSSSLEVSSMSVLRRERWIFSSPSVSISIRPGRVRAPVCVKSEKRARRLSSRSVGDLGLGQKSRVRDRPTGTGPICLVHRHPGGNGFHPPIPSGALCPERARAVARTRLPRGLQASPPRGRHA